ncbi:MAG: 4'-phosphopantetheinyl transferase superfamily protein [Betaproteobacteria bacterium]|nr:4'-phosphopantetheinyl transferase superfamily protein [Betaproteobacteria bacterium]
MIGAEEIHIWRFDLSGGRYPDSRRFLDESELRRADRFVFERDRTRFERSRYCLRHILALYLKIDPRQLPIVVGPHGKPLLMPEDNLGFNLSHSGDNGLLAIGRAVDIGIDIETTIAPRDLRRLAQTVFSTEETKALDSIADDALTAPFFTCWTRKEAYLKAIGLGFTLDPKSITVGIDAGRRRIAIDGGPVDRFVEVATTIEDDACIASVAVVGGYSALKFFKYPLAHLDSFS